jgi:preprotein translocase subunit YajC
LVLVLVYFCVFLTLQNIHYFILLKRSKKTKKQMDYIVENRF